MGEMFRTSSVDGREFRATDHENSVPQWLQRFRQILRLSNSSLLGSMLIGLAKASQTNTQQIVPPLVRSLVSTGLPVDPLRRSKDLPEIDIAIPFVEKDIAILPRSVESAVKWIRNPINSIYLITPSDPGKQVPKLALKRSAEILRGLMSRHPNVVLRFDHDIVGEELWRAIEAEKPGGWVVQQLVKFSVVLQPQSRPTLILDSDTVLLSPKTWLAGNQKQLLQVAHEFEPRYMDLVRKHFRLEKSLGLSFVTHHQMMQPDIVREMFPNGPASLLEWWRESLLTEGAHLSEYEAYGTYLLERYPNRVALGSWSNLLSPYYLLFNKRISVEGRDPSELIPHYCSVSFHADSQQDKAS